MALDSDRLGADILARVEATGAAVSVEALAIYTAIAAAIVAELRDHAVVTIPIDAGDVGLQSYNAGAGPIPTTGPIAPTTLDGTIG